MITSNIEYFKGNGFVAEVIRTSRKKTVSVKVKDGAVSIIIPSNLSQSRVEELLNKKTRWINKKLQLYAQSSPLSPKEYVSGESFFYLGKSYRLKIESGEFKSVILENENIVVTLKNETSSPNKIKNALSNWFKNNAEQKLTEKIEKYAKIVEVTPSSLRIKAFKARWGSCCTNAVIQLNWKIIMAPHDIIDYVVVHELCHIKEHNHSPKFWKLVKEIIPEYLEHKQWLKKHGEALYL